MASIRARLTAERNELRQSPLAWASSWLRWLRDSFIEQIRKLTTPDKLKETFVGLFLSLLRGAVIAVLLLVVVHFNFPGLQNFLLSFKNASQKDIQNITRSMEAYEDFLNQKNERAGRYLTKQQELFLDIVKTAFPMKIESGLISLSDAQRHELNARRPVPVYARFARFKSEPHIHPILKNLEFVNQPDRKSWVRVTRQQCSQIECRLEVQLIHPDRSRPAPLVKNPQIHWIATGEFPDAASTGESNEPNDDATPEQPG